MACAGWKRVSFASLSILGLINLSFFLGVLVILLRVPPFPFLRDAFVAYTTWRHHGEESSPPGPHREELPSQVDVPKKTCDGYTLVMLADRDELKINQVQDLAER
jgi:hypothetical protein